MLVVLSFFVCGVIVTAATAHFLVNLFSLVCHIMHARSLHFYHYHFSRFYDLYTTQLRVEISSYPTLYVKCVYEKVFVSFFTVRIS